MAWWRDIKEIKEWMSQLTARIALIDHVLEKILGESQKKKETTQVLENEIEDLRECIEDTFCSDDEYSSFNRIHDKLDILVRDADRQKSVILAEMTLDKFEDYMKNVDKLNAMINEFKGCVSMARGALKTSKGKDTV